MSVLKDFKDFAVKGNVVDLAVGVIIGAAFGKIVSSFVGDVVMPPLGLLTGGVDFKELGLVLKPAQGTSPAVILKYGAFLQSVFDFLIVASAIFALVQALSKLKKKEAAPAGPAPEPPRQEVLLEQIRDAIRAEKLGAR
jgi:large conductance mechanosensitive channel